MSKKVNIIIGTLVVLAVAIVLIVSASSKKNQEAQLPTANEAVSGTTTTGTTGTVTTPASGAKSYTLAEVATHNNKADCWATINGSVYNVTSWISQHPGGQEAILSLCGKDGSSLFNGQHGGDARPASELASFKIGALAK
jgi:cytochrome b involved in lipid metabolism